jgi:hypothetical protein
MKPSKEYFPKDKVLSWERIWWDVSLENPNTAAFILLYATYLR